MKSLFLFLAITLVLPLLGGCSHCAVTSPDTSAVEVHLIAESRQGVAAPDSSGDYSGPAMGPQFEKLDYAHLPGIVVWLEPVDAKSNGNVSTANTPVRIDDRSKDIPEVQGVCVGTRLIFQNQGSREQKIYSVSDGNEFDLGALPPGKEASFVVRNPGMVEVLSETAPNPVARFYATPGAFVQTVRSGETACFVGIPPGAYRINCWHERLPGSKQMVQLDAGKSADVTLKVGVNSLPPIRVVANSSR